MVLAHKRSYQQINDWVDLWFNPHKQAGYVAVTDFERQLFFGANDVSKVINMTKGKQKQFISVNSFDVNWNEKEFSRETAKLKQIRNIAIDIDQYKLGLTIDEALDEIQLLILDNKIPEPNLILTSRGIQIFYSIDRGASPKMSWLAGYITEQIISKLNHIGADSNAKDMSRVMRVPNSINERNNALVKPYIWNDEAYTLQELQSYCKPLEHFGTRKKTKTKVIPINAKVSLFYKTNYARLTDLRKLFDLRQGDFTGMRNTFIYMYAYHQSLLLNTQQDVIQDVTSALKDIYSKTDKPMTKREIESTIKSAYKDAEGFFESYKANGYRVVYKQNDGIKKPYKTSNFIKKLNITIEEQKALKVLCSPEIKKQHKADYMRNKRLEDGITKGNAEEYNSKRKQRKETITLIAKELRDKGKTLQEIAEITRVSKGYISQILKQ